MAGDVKALGSMASVATNPIKPDDNAKGGGKSKVKPLSKQLVSKLQGCSQRLTEVMTWQAKLEGSPLRLA